MKQDWLLYSLFLIQLLTGGSNARAAGSTSLNGPFTTSNYRARRYGNYHSTKYFSYSGGRGYARYSRVYDRKKNKYRNYYFKMFDWFKTEEFYTYQSTPSEYISVCRNYEADSNGTYIGIYTCPLPIYPETHTYCCGVENAEYCCQFWDVPQNVLAFMIVAIMGGIILMTLCYIIFMLKRTEHLRNVTAKRKKSFFRKKQLVEFYEEMTKKHKAWPNPSLFGKTSGLNSDDSDCQHEP